MNITYLTIVQLIISQTHLHLTYFLSFPLFGNEKTNPTVFFSFHHIEKYIIIIIIVPHIYLQNC